LNALNKAMLRRIPVESAVAAAARQAYGAVQQAMQQLAQSNAAPAQTASGIPSSGISVNA
jgi:hypothetical protein